MRDTLTLQCRCGAVKGRLNGLTEQKPRRIVCLCVDCQAFAHYLGRAADVLTRDGGTDILPVYPSQITWTEGQEHLKCMRLSPKGLYRWYTDCCKTPVANCPPNPRLPYTGVIHSIMCPSLDGTTADAALGPIYARIMGKSGIPPLEKGTHENASLSVILMALRLIAKGFIQGKHQPSPFFDAKTGKPRVEPTVLTLAQRQQLRTMCGPPS